MSNPEQYTVGWICAITTEYTAARQFLDEEHDRPDHLSPNDANDYTLGKMAGHNVVIAVLPDGEYGLSSATGVAKDMLHSFPNVRVGLMVGIGGGAPTNKNDIRLGDIVVSSPKDGTGGVYQYDYGKTIQGRRFQQTGFLDQPPTVVRTAVSGLKSKCEDGGHQIEASISAILDKRPRLRKKYSRPSQESDRLYKPDVIHPHDGEGDCDTLCGSQITHIVPRRQREEDEDNPAIHYGIIASANRLMKDAIVRDSLAKEKNILCFEMEAAGLMKHFPCLVVRGICDYSDSHKNKQWQGYAAMTAAAYAKELLARMVPSRVETEQKLRDNFDSMSWNIEDIRSTVQEVYSLRKQEHTDQIIRWLSPPDASTNYNMALKQRHVGTGLWFITGQAFGQWKTKPDSFLWLHGIPGCGKTVLSSAIIENLARDVTGSEVILYFYFDFSDTEKQSVDSMMRCLISQLYQQCNKVRQHLDQAWTSCKEGKQQPSLELLTTTLRVMLSETDDVSIVLDALDESCTRHDLLAWLRSLSMTKAAACRLLVTSRRQEDIESAFRTWTRSEDRIAIQQADVNGEINAYINDRVHNDAELKRWRNRPDVQEEIKARLMEKAGGMFRWVVCQIDALRRCLDYPTLRKALSNLPESLDETYARILNSIPGWNIQTAITILQLLTWSDRPLDLEEIIDAIAVQPGQNPSFDPRDRLPVPREILKVCSGLVVLARRSKIASSTKESSSSFSSSMEERNWEIRLAHFSVKEYLMSNRIIGRFMENLAETKARTSIAILCLAYLSDLNHELPLQEVIAKFPFSTYCARYWTDHARAAGMTDAEDSPLQRRIMEFFKRRNTTYLTCYSLFDPDTPWQEAKKARKKFLPGPLYYASLGGLTCSTSILLREGADPNAQGGRYGNALQAASCEGYDDIVRFLLDKGANVDSQGGEYGNALNGASASGHIRLVRTLLDSKAKLFDVDLRRRSPLHWAIFGEDAAIVRLLLEHGAKEALEWPDFQRCTALHLALQYRVEEIADLLLDEGARVTGPKEGFRKTGMGILKTRLMKISPEIYDVNKGLTHRLKLKRCGQAFRLEILNTSEQKKSALLLSSRMHGAEKQIEDLLVQVSPPMVFRKTFRSDVEEDALRRIARERRLLERLHHPNIVSFLGFDVIDDKQTGDPLLHLYMEYCEGGDLSPHVQPLQPDKASGYITSDCEEDSGDECPPSPKMKADALTTESISLAHAWSICEDLASALAYCHHGVELRIKEDGSRMYSLLYSWPDPIIHRDIKPDNVVCAYQNGRRVTKLCDFGFSRFKNWEGRPTRNFGTWESMPPEMLAHGYTAKGDIYALGKTLSRLATNEKSRSWQHMVEHCQSLNPDQRPSSLTVLQIAREEIRRLPRSDSNANSPYCSFLPHAAPALSYIEQAVCEVFDRYSKLLSRLLKGKQQSADFVQLARRVEILLSEARPQDIKNFSEKDWSILSSICPTNIVKIKPETGNKKHLIVCKNPGLTPFHFAASFWAGYQARKKGHRLGSKKRS